MGAEGVEAGFEVADFAVDSWEVVRKYRIFVVRGGLVAAWRD